MKSSLYKLLVLIIAFSMLISISACSGEKEESSLPSESKPSEATSSDEVSETVKETETETESETTISDVVGFDHWTILPGALVDGVAVPAKIEIDGDNIIMTSPEGYYDDTGNYQGIILNMPVDVKNFSIEFTIDEYAGSASSVDTWIGIHLLNQKHYFSVADPSKSQGLVTLLRPYGHGNIVQSFQHVTAFGWNGDEPVAKETIGDWKYEFVYNDDTTYSLFIDGVEAGAIFDNFGDVFPDGKAYLAIGASTNNNEKTVLTITKINGEPASQYGKS